VVIYIAHGGWGYNLGVIETGHVGCNRDFERWLGGGNNEDPVVDVLEKEQHIPAAPGMTSTGRKAGLKDRVAIQVKQTGQNLPKPCWLNNPN
jgi:hypothetical protein